MKKYVILFCFLSLNSKNEAQIVFCPPGAEWHYSFMFGFPSQNIFYNEKIYYKNDTVINSQSYKVLRHSQALWSNCLGVTNITLIKQNGDTIFMRNAFTLHQWQILYNFAALPGQSWTNTLTSGSASLTYTIVVDAVSTIQINGTNLKQLNVKYNGSPSIINERLGSNQFLFNFYYSNCDGYYFKQRLCYKDNAFTETLFSSLSCDYNTTGLQENLKLESNLKLFPNPVTNDLIIESEILSESEIEIANAIGQIIISKKVNSKKEQINVGDWPKGIYFVKVKNQQTEKTFKVVKE